MTNWLETLFGATRTQLLPLFRRPPQTVTSMAVALGLTDNAVRIHVTALGRGRRHRASEDRRGLEVHRIEAGWRVQGYGCPLLSARPGHPELWNLAGALIEQIAPAPVTECCDRSDCRGRGC